MSGRSFNELFRNLPLVGILRGFRASEIERIVTACIAGGLTNIEITMNTDGAAAQIRSAIAAAEGRMNVGAGTVTTCRRLDAAMEAGASFIVTPAVIPEVIDECVSRTLPVIPGAFSPTEVWSAWEAGATMVKLFPAELGGPAYAKSLKGPFPDVELIATGGVSLKTLRNYLEAGVEGFGLGSSICTRERVDAGDWEWMTEQVRKHREIYEAFNGS